MGDSSTYSRKLPSRRAASRALGRVTPDLTMGASRGASLPG